MTDGNGNGRNGLFLKVVMAVCVAGLIGCGALIVRLNNDVAVLMAATQADRRIDDLRREVSEVRSLAESINADRHQRTQIIRDFERRIDALERRR